MASSFVSTRPLITSEIFGRDGMEKFWGPRTPLGESGFGFCEVVVEDAVDDDVDLDVVVVEAEPPLD